MLLNEVVVVETTRRDNCKVGQIIRLSSVLTEVLVWLCKPSGGPTRTGESSDRTEDKRGGRGSV
jgi:hypothetical protein